jgi:hypothetical protein
MDKDSLIKGIKAGRAQLEELLSQVSHPHMLEIAMHEQWSVKDFISHLAFWERRAASLYQILASGGVPTPVGEEALDKINERAYQDQKGLSLDDALSDEQAAYRALLTLAENASEIDLIDEKRFAWLNGTPFAQVLADNTSGHYAEHLPALQAWFEQNTSTQ